MTGPKHVKHAPPKTDDRLTLVPLIAAAPPDLAGIMAKTTTPDQCLTCAQSRIE